MKQLQLSQSPLVAVVNYAEVDNVAAVAVISLLTIVNEAAVADVAAVAFISHVTLVNYATFAPVNAAAVEVVNVAAVEVFYLSVAADAVINAVAVALITDLLSTGARRLDRLFILSLSFFFHFHLFCEPSQPSMPLDSKNTQL